MSPATTHRTAVFILLVAIWSASAAVPTAGLQTGDDPVTPDAWPNLGRTPARTSSFGSAGGGTGQVIWDHRVPQPLSRSSPAVVGDAVYIGTKSGVHAVDRLTGEGIWRTSASTVGGHVHSSPAVVDGLVYVGTWLFGGNVTALDAETGEVVWSRQVDERIFSSPAVADGRVFVGTSQGGRGGEEHEGSVVALDAGTGELLWTHPTDHVVRSSPTVVDGVVYVGSSEGRVYAFEAATGQLAWPGGFFRTAGHVESSPAVVGGRVYVSSCTGSCEQPRNATLFALDAATGTKIWDRDLYAPQRAPIAVRDDVLYFGGDDGIVWAVRDTGDDSEIVWRNATINHIKSGPAQIDGMVYVTSMDHRVHALDDDTGQPEWQYYDPERGHPITSTPAVVDGRIYFFMDDHLYALDAGAGVPGSSDDGGDDGGGPSIIPVPSAGGVAVVAAIGAATLLGRWRADGSPRDER